MTSCREKTKPSKVVRAKKQPPLRLITCTPDIAAIEANNAPDASTSSSHKICRSLLSNLNILADCIESDVKTFINF